MATERQVQTELIRFFTEELGYHECPSSSVGEDVLIRPEILAFLQSEVNVKNYKTLMKEYGGDTHRMLDDYCKELQVHLYTRYNVAVRLKSGNFKFKGLDFKLWNKSGSQVMDYSGDDRFCVVEEVVVRPKTPMMKGIYSRRFDLCFFINGIYFSYMELKHISQGQNAVEHGRVKVVSNYLEAVGCFAYERLDYKDTSDERKQRQVEQDIALSVFERAIYVVASDLRETYAIRNIKTHQNAMRENLHADSSSVSFVEQNPQFMKDFPLLPSDVVSDDSMSHAKDVFTQMYAKENVENEILYYNYIRKTGQKKGGHYTLISPRPKQRFGVDKTVARVLELYHNENNPRFVEDELRQKMSGLHFPSSEIEREVKDRAKLTNNQTIYSILKQYAAGFGKTALMSWEALRLNELNHPLDKQSKLFDKIILLSDRIDLKQQMGATLETMPTIKRAAWDEVETVSEFGVKLQDDTCRIIVVNVQKFNHIGNNLTRQAKKLLAGMRVAFIIDEIHRSHNGKQNEEMQDMFFKNISNMSSSQSPVAHEPSVTLSSMSSVSSPSGVGCKKNIIIGLTATVSDRILKRFGEVSPPNSKGLHFTPFDTYTMNEAIKEGYVLDPMTRFVPVNIPIFIKEMSDYTNYKKMSGKDVYQDKEYIHNAVDHSFKTMLHITFRSIRGEGKSMYVANNIDSAIIAFDRFKELIEKEKHNPVNQTILPEVYIVFSDSGQQHRRTSFQLNNGMSEADTIQSFKHSKNGIMIVVDKLQTGFDEPKLHTLVLCTERQGINMVQTLCRLNRTANHKKDCLVLDYSMLNEKTGVSKNSEFAKYALDKYAGMNMTSFNVAERETGLKRSYDALLKDELFKRLFELYKESLSNAENDTSVFTPEVLALSDKQADDLFALGTTFFTAFNEVDGIFDYAKKYTNRHLPLFFKKVRSIRAIKGNKKLPLPFEVSDIQGFSVEHIEEVIANPKEKSKPKSSSKKDKPQIDRLKEQIKALNLFNELNEESIEKVNAAIFSVFGKLKFKMINNDGSEIIKTFYNKLKTDRYDDHLPMFMKSFTSIVRREKRKDAFIMEHATAINAFVEQLDGHYYEEFVSFLYSDD